MGDAPKDNVVNFRPVGPSASLKKQDWTDKRRQCQHVAVEVWADEPILECQECGAVVDPYRWIRDRVSDWDQITARQEFRKREIVAELNELRAALKVLRGEYADERERQAAKSALMVLPPRRRTPCPSAYPPNHTASSCGAREGTHD